MVTYSLSLIQNPTGTWSFVGKVPEILAYARRDGKPLTDEDRQVIQHCGPGFRKKQIKTVTFATSEEAVMCAKNNNIHIDQILK